MTSACRATSGRLALVTARFFGRYSPGNRPIQHPLVSLGGQFQRQVVFAQSVHDDLQGLAGAKPGHARTGMRSVLAAASKAAGS